MFHTAVTLICNPAAPVLDNELGGKVSCFLDSVDMGAARRVVLAPGVAEDFLLSGKDDPKALEQELRGFLAGAPIDIVVQPAAGREKKLLIADMDSTIIEQECIDELADFAGLRDEISAITERAMRGELDFEGALKERVGMLKGLGQDKLAACVRERISLTPGAKTLVATMNARGAKTALVSGGFTYFTEKVAALSGFQSTQANTLLIEGGVLTGAVAMPILGRDAKKEALLRLAAEAGIGPRETLAVGDGANDLAMLAAAGLGVAFRAKPAVAASAHARIEHGDLTALLYLQGLSKADFAEV